MRLTTISFVSALLVLVSGRNGWGQLTPPSELDRRIAQQAGQILEGIHIRRTPLDDAMSKRFLDSYLETLDPWNVYFLADDVEEFEKRADKLDDDLRLGQLAFAFKVFSRFLFRLDERMEAVEGLIKAEHDFSIDEFVETEREDLPFPKDDEEARERWRKNIKLQLLERVAGGVELSEARETLGRRYRDFTRVMHQTENADLLQLFLSAVSRVYDPHTSYLSAASLEDFAISMRLELEGIGAALRSEDGFTIVSQIVPGGAAARDGRLQPGDKIIGVAQGADGELEDVRDQKLSNVVKQIRGDRGTTVRLELIKAETNKREVIVPERAKVELSYSEAYGEVIEEERADGGKLRVGVVELPSFYSDLGAAGAGVADYKSSTRDVERILERFNEEKIDAVVVDLRGNAGGALSEAIEMTGLFIDEGPVVQIKGPRGIEQRFDEVAGRVWDGPLVVITDKMSASASEIFAGAIQDYRRGLVIGDPSTHGKGTVQQLLDLAAIFKSDSPGSQGAMKVTISQFYRANGSSTQSRGVVPDIELPARSSVIGESESELDYAIEFDRIDAVPFDPENHVSAGLVAKLEERSRARRAASDQFQKLVEDLDRYRALKERERIPLKEEKFVSEYRLENDATDPSDPGAEAGPEQPAPDLADRTIRRDFYLDEVLAITRDYVELKS